MNVYEIITQRIMEQLEQGTRVHIKKLARVGKTGSVQGQG